MLIGTTEAANAIGLSERELREGFKKGKYPALVVCKHDCSLRGAKLLWDINLLEESIKNQMVKSMRENKEKPSEEEFE